MLSPGRRRSAPKHDVSGVSLQSAVGPVQVLNADQVLSALVRCVKPSETGAADALGGRGGTAEGEEIAEGPMARSLVADLSGRTAEAISTTIPRLHVPEPLPVAKPQPIDELEAAFAHFDGHPDTAPAFRAAADRARALAEAAEGED